MRNPVLDLTEMRARLRANRSILDRFHVRRIAVFGSLVRGTAGPDSDVDLLVEFSEPLGMFSVLRLERELSDLLGRKVDLVTPPALKPPLRDQILAEAVDAA